MIAPRLFVAVLAVALLAGCDTYQLAGRVVSGPRSQVVVVGADDPRLTGPPVADASVQVVIDPNSAGRTVLPLTWSDESGRFTLPVDKLGAGALEYEMLVIGRAPKKNPAEAVLDLPPAKKRVLIVLADGRDRDVRAENPWRDAQEQIDRHFPR